MLRNITIRVNLHQLRLSFENNNLRWHAHLFGMNSVLLTQKLVSFVFNNFEGNISFNIFH